MRSEHAAGRALTAPHVDPAVAAFPKEINITHTLKTIEELAEWYKIQQKEQKEIEANAKKIQAQLERKRLDARKKARLERLQNIDHQTVTPVSFSKKDGKKYPIKVKASNGTFMYPGSETTTTYKDGATATTSGSLNILETQADFDKATLSPGYYFVQETRLGCFVSCKPGTPHYWFNPQTGEKTKQPTPQLNPKEARLKAAALKKLKAQELPTEPGKAAPNLQQPIAVVIEIATLADIKSPGIYRVLDKDTLCEAKMVRGRLMHRPWKPSNAKTLPPAA